MVRKGKVEETGRRRDALAIEAADLKLILC
jgi:hypothetical protein